MPNRFIADAAGLFTLDVEVNGPVLGEALEHDRAEDLLRCAVIVALSALAQDAPWPERTLNSLTALMLAMREQVGAAAT